jgi:D-lactate dehydrogenase
MMDRNIFDVIHFEALGPEASHLQEETARAMAAGLLPPGHRCLVTPLTLQSFLEANPGTPLPGLVTTKTHSVLPEGFLAEGGKGVITRSAGYDHFEHLVGQLHVASLREYCVDAVAQTAMKFIYAAAGMMNHYCNHAQSFDRQACQAFLSLDRSLTATVFGVGKIGKRIHDLVQANGLTVQGVDLRQRTLAASYGDSVRFVAKDEAIASSDLIINAMNLTRDPASPLHNVGYFSRDYLAKARKPLIFINVTRGEIAPEAGLLELYRGGQIIGMGLDVFSHEAACTRMLQGEATGDPDLMAAKALITMARERTGNVYVQPHQGFNSNIAARTKAAEAIKHVVAWFRNSGRRFDEELPYY